jgi:hypothetical protein
MTRPCQWPDGGCGAEVEFVPTGKTKPDGKPVLMILDRDPAPNGIVVVREGLAVVTSRARPARLSEALRVPHHATCPKWAAKVERERAAKAARP